MNASGPAEPAPTDASSDVLRRTVRERYGAIARDASRGCDCTCGSDYAPHELAALPDGAELGLGCGHPTALAELAEGEVVLDLGSGAGVDCFLAAQRVGPTGRVIGVDMTPEMIERARANARATGAANVEFRLGEIEHLPVADASVDVVVSNCVVNLSTDKGAVFREARRVLRPGGRLVVSDIVATDAMPDAIRADAALHASCVSGAVPAAENERLLREAGFRDVSVTPAAGAKHADYPVVSATIRARR